MSSLQNNVDAPHPSHQDLEIALTSKLDPEFIVTLLQESGNYDLVKDAYAHALNTHNRDLENAIINAYPELLDDSALAHDVWIYTQIYDRPDLEDWSVQHLDQLPWNEVLPIAITEDIDPVIQTALLEGNFSQEDLALALVAAYRLGNQEMKNYIGAMVGPYWEEMVKKGLVIIELPDGSVPYYILFQQDKKANLSIIQVI